MKNRSFAAKILLLMILLTAMAFLSPPAGSEPVSLGKYERKSNRDPFMPPVGPMEKKTPPAVKTKTAPPPVKTTVVPPEKPKDVRVLSGMTLTGIVKTSTKLRAVIKSSDGKGYAVSVGQSAGTWTVTAIKGKTAVVRRGIEYDVLELVTKDIKK